MKPPPVAAGAPAPAGTATSAPPRFPDGAPGPLAQTRPGVELAAAASASLTPMARLLGGISSAGALLSAEQISSPVPVLPVPEPEAAVLARALASALERSGLFYESHLAQWAAGERPLAALLEEPQARLGTSPAGQRAEADAPLEQEPGARLPGNARAGASPPASAPSAASAPPLDPAAIPQVHQQLEAIASGLVQWRGELWPGQPFEWEVADRRNAPGEAESAAWETRLRLTLPQLGGVEAVLQLAPQGLRVALRADRDEALDRLAKGSPDLTARLGAAGLRVIAMNVERHGRPR